MTINSFHDVLRQPRTMHSLELPFSTKRIGLPRPVPYISAIYFVLIVVALMTANKVIDIIPTMGSIFSSLSGGNASIAATATYFVLIPAAIVWAAMNAEVDGRAPHRWAFSCAQFLVRNKRTICGASARKIGCRVNYRGKIGFLWDIDCPRLQQGFITGGFLSTSVPVRFTYSFRHCKRRIVPSSDGVLLDAHEVDGKIEVRR